MIRLLLACALSLAALDVWLWAYRANPDVMIAAMRVLP